MEGEKMKFFRKKGFTLLELMIVIIIIGILASIGIPRYFNAIQQARDAEAKGTLSEIYKVEQAVYSVTDNFIAGGIIINGATIGANLDGVEGNEIEMVVPDSPNYAYTKAAQEGPLLATSTTGSKNWAMSLETGEFTNP
jgi:prepilin-type N-terminal cleavage/methylation domain-containing protein